MGKNRVVKKFYGPWEVVVPAGVKSVKVKGFQREKSRFVGYNSACITGMYDTTQEEGLLVWGSGANFVLGNGSTANITSPVLNGTRQRYKKIRMSQTNGGGLSVDGFVALWGVNGTRQIGDDSTTSRSVPWLPNLFLRSIEKKDFICLYDGMIWFDNAKRQIVCGGNANGRLGNGAITNVTTPTYSNQWVGEFCFADGYDNHGAAVSTFGSLVTWGNNGMGKLGDGTTVDRSVPVWISNIGTAVNMVNVGRWNTAFISEETSPSIKNRVFVCGTNEFGSCGQGTISTVPVTTFVEIVGNGSNKSWSDISVGHNHVLGICENGELYGWGANNFGQVSSGNAFSLVSEPYSILQYAPGGGNKRFKEVHAGNDWSMAIDEDDNIYTWGAGGDFRLGNGSTATVGLPTKLNGVKYVPYRKVAFEENIDVVPGSTLAFVTSYSKPMRMNGRPLGDSWANEYEIEYEI